MRREEGSGEVYFRCPKCGSVYSTDKQVLKADRYTKSSVTNLFLGGSISPMAFAPKCSKCHTKLETITAEAFRTEMSKGVPGARRE